MIPDFPTPTITTLPTQPAKELHHAIDLPLIKTSRGGGYRICFQLQQTDDFGEVWFICHACC